MLVYVYDGSFQGLLTAIYEAYYGDMFPDFIRSRINLQYSILDTYAYIESDETKSDKVYCSINDRISSEAMKHVYNVYLSEDADAGNLIFQYLRFGWKVGSKVDMFMTDDRVFKVHDISRRVEFEKHRMFGFVRFRQVEGNMYYAPVCPDNNIVELLAPHFAERVCDQNWIIHDTKRSIAAFYNKSDWLITDFTIDELPEMTENEVGYQKLWKEFFKSVAIQSRENLKLQRQFMPRRYWRYLTEKS